MTATGLVETRKESIESDDESPSELESEDSDDSPESTYSITPFGQFSMQHDALQGYFDAIVSIVDKLFDASILIRGVSGNFRADRAAEYAEKAVREVLEEFKTLVALKIRWLYPDTPDWLIERLTKVIAMRRQQFYYQKAHKGKMSGLQSKRSQADHAQMRRSDRAGKQALTSDPGSVKPEATVASVPTVPMAPKTARTGTTSKTYDTIATDPIVLGNERVVTPAFPKITPSEKLGESAFPNPPKEPQGKAFECPQCFRLLPADTRRRALWTFVTLVFYELTL